MMKIIKKIFGPRGAKITAGEIASKFGLELRGDPKTPVRSVAPIADAGPGQLAFYSTERNSAAFKILPIALLQNARASVLLVQPEHVHDAPANTTLLIAESPRGNIVKILDEIYREKPLRGIHWSAHIERGVFFRRRSSVYIGQFATIARGAVIERNVKIYPNVFIGRNVVIGENAVIRSGARIENATIGANCVINSNAVIGKDGFGYTRQDGHNIFIPHVGRAILGDRVSVGASTCIDRGVMTDTIIGDGTKIDNLCQIAHGVVIGKECFLASGVGLAGGVIVGDRVLFGGQTAIANGVKIGDDVEVGAKSGVLRDIPSGIKVVGYPAVPGMEFMRAQVWVKNQMKK